jgi:hypothetical protein
LPAFGYFAASASGSSTPGRPAARSRAHTSRAGHLLLQRAAQARRKHDHAILAALAFAHHDHAALEIQVLDAQPQTFDQPQARPVHQLHEQRELARNMRQQACHLLARQHDRNAHARLGPDELLHPRQLDVQHFPVQEQDRAQRLLVRQRRHRTRIGQMTQEGLDLGCTHLARMPQAMMPDERADPVDMGLPGS